MSVLDQPRSRARPPKKVRRTKERDPLGWIAGVMILIGAVLCLAALLNV